MSEGKDEGPPRPSEESDESQIRTQLVRNLPGTSWTGTVAPLGTVGTVTPGTTSTRPTPAHGPPVSAPTDLVKYVGPEVAAPEPLPAVTCIGISDARPNLAVLARPARRGSFSGLEVKNTGAVGVNCLQLSRTGGASDASSPQDLQLVSWGANNSETSPQCSFPGMFASLGRDDTCIQNGAGSHATGAIRGAGSGDEARPHATTKGPASRAGPTGTGKPMTEETIQVLARYLQAKQGRNLLVSQGRVIDVKEGEEGQSGSNMLRLELSVSARTVADVASSGLRAVDTMRRRRASTGGDDDDTLSLDITLEACHEALLRTYQVGDTRGPGPRSPGGAGGDSDSLRVPSLGPTGPGPGPRAAPPDGHGGGGRSRRCPLVLQLLTDPLLREALGAFFVHYKAVFDSGAEEWEKPNLLLFGDYSGGGVAAAAAASGPGVVSESGGGAVPSAAAQKVLADGIRRELCLLEEHPDPAFREAAARRVFFHDPYTHIEGLDQRTSNELVVSTVRGSTVTGLRFLRTLTGKQPRLTRCMHRTVAPAATRRAGLRQEEEEGGARGKAGIILARGGGGSSGGDSGGGSTMEEEEEEEEEGSGPGKDGILLSRGGGGGGGSDSGGGSAIKNRRLSPAGDALVQGEVLVRGEGKKALPVMLGVLGLESPGESGLRRRS